MKKVFLIIIIFSLTGCWNYRELNELALTTGVALDKTEDGYLLTVLISNSKKSNSSGNEEQASTVVYEGKGNTLFEAGKDVALEVSKQIYPSHIKILILSEEIAKTELIETIDYIFRYPQIRNEFYVVVADNCKAGDVLKITTPLESFPSDNISKNLELDNKLQGLIYGITLNKLVEDILESGISPTLPTINLIGNVEKGNKDENIKQNMPDTYLKLGTMAIFKKDKLVNIGDKDESKGINILSDRVSTTIIPSEINNGNIIVEVNSIKPKYEIILNDIPEVNIKIEADGAIQEVEADVDLTNSKVIETIKKNTEDKVNEIINKSISFIQNNKTDVIGIGKMIRKKDYRYWNNLKANWDDDVFPQIKFNVNTTFSMETKGNISNIIKEG